MNDQEQELPEIEILSEADIIAHQKAKRAAWMRDKQLIAEGKLRPEDLSWAHIMGLTGGVIDFSKVEAAIADDEEWEDSND